MSAFLNLFGRSTVFLLNESASDRPRPSQGVVPDIVLKELDHVQAIVGRFDAYFFLMKQICLVSTLAALGFYWNGKEVDGVGFLIGIPVLFGIFDYLFRALQWSRYISRVRTIQQFLQNGNDLANVYELREGATFPPPPCYDVIFYSFLIVIILLAATVFTGNPWKIPGRNPSPVVVFVRKERVAGTRFSACAGPDGTRSVQPFGSAHRGAALPS